MCRVYTPGVVVSVAAREREWGLVTVSYIAIQIVFKAEVQPTVFQCMQRTLETLTGLKLSKSEASTDLPKFG